MKLAKFLGLAGLLLLGTGLVLSEWSSETASPAGGAAGAARVAGDLWISGPHRHKNLEVYLVHGPDRVPDGERILTLEEAIQQKQAIVHETGEVERLVIESLAPDAEVFVQAGDMVQGGNQDRVLAVDLLVSQKSGRTDMASFCVEEGRWSVRGSGGGSRSCELAEEAIETDIEETIEADIAEAEATSEVDMVESAFSSSRHALPTPGLRRAVMVAGDQDQVWEGVRQCQQRLQWILGHQDVIPEESASSLERTVGGAKVQEAGAEYVRVLSGVPNGNQEGVPDGNEEVVGAVFAVNGKVTSGDIYGSRHLFRKLWPKLLRAGAVEAVTAVEKAGAREEASAGEEVGATEPGSGREAVGCQKVAEFLAGAVGRRVTVEDLTDRIQFAHSEGPADHFFETRDRDRNLAWIHRSYLAK